MKSPNEDKLTEYILIGFGIIPVILAALTVAPFLSDGLAGIVKGLTHSMNNPINIQWCADSPKAILVFLAAYGTGIGVYFSTRRNYRRGEEHGSAKWGNARRTCKKYAEKDSRKNLILTQNVRIGLDGRMHRRNLNVLVVGGSGAGKTRFYAKPNIMQANTSYVVLDPKGEILRDTGYLLERYGYDIKVLDLIHTERSHGFNPFVYLRDDKDVLRLVNNLIRNTTPKGAQSSDPFWERAETALLEALILYLVNEAPPEEQNFSMVMEMINAAEVREDDEEYASVLDELFERLAMRDPEHLAVKQYHIFKLAAGKTAKSILISCGARLAPFDIPQLREIMSYDELELDRIGDRKTAVFFTISDTTPTYNFIVALAFSQMFNLLCERADNVHGGRLPHHVRVLWDEAANTGQVPNLEKLVAVIRSREVSLCLFYQQLAQCKAIYDKHAETILGNMDSVIFLGGREASTIKEISENWLGKATISMQTEGRSRGQSESYNQNTLRLGRELMTPSELATMPGDKCILQLRGLPPFFSPKYDLKQHPNYKQTAEADKKKNAFDLDKLINRRRRPGLNEACEVYKVAVSETSLTDEDEDILNYDDVDDPDAFV